MDAFVLGGRLAELVIAITLVEAAVIVWWRRARGRGPGLAALAPALASGLFLMLALRAAQADAGWPWIATALSGAGLAHAVDLARRWSP